VTTIDGYERTHLCALAEQLGPDAPTLCEGWTVRDLVVHLLVRERSLAAAGIVIPALEGWMDRVSERRAREDFHHLVSQLRNGPPVLSLYAVPKLGAALNTLEYFVHHEDIRRAQPGWKPRQLPAKVEDALWRAVRHAGRGLTATAPVGVAAARSDTGDETTFKSGDGVVLRGLPSELVIYVFGRKEQSLVEVTGKPEHVQAMQDKPLGI
jgi:uncharacterized protein (TIGR03085 family)